jgi:hypothetical protein
MSPPEHPREQRVTESCIRITGVTLMLNLSATEAVVDPEEAALSAGLSYVSDDKAGISRQRRGKGFTYKVGGKTVRMKKRSNASGPSPSRRRGRTYGSAPRPPVISRPQVAMPRVESSIGITRASARSERARNTIACWPLRKACLQSAQKFKSTCPNADCRVRRSSRRSFTCSRRPSYA